MNDDDDDDDDGVVVLEDVDGVDAIVDVNENDDDVLRSMDCFCTMALADSRIEQDLGIDGVTESILYTAGVGTRPRTTKSARWPSRPLGREVPNLSR